MYKYYNRNPNNDIKGDCVCKAISTATGLNYDAVDNLLELTANIYMTVISYVYAAIITSWMKYYAMNASIVISI